MKKTKILFSTMGVQERFDDDKRKCSCRITHNAVLEAAEIAADMAEEMRIDEVDAKYYLGMVATYITRALASGKKLNLGPFSLSLAMRGCVYGANGRFEKGRNALAVNISPGREMKRALEALEPVNALEDSASASARQPRITSAIDSATREEGAVSAGARLLVAGENLQVDPDAPDETVFLEDDERGILAKGVVTKSSSITLDCIFEASPDVPEKRCWLAIYTRGGAEGENRARPAMVARRRILWRVRQER